VDAIRGRYTLTYRMVSVKERFKWFILNGTPIEQTRLNLSAFEAQKTLKLAIQRSHTLGFSSRYSLLTANCTNLALELIKDANPLRQRELSQNHPWTSKVRDTVDKYTTFLDAFTQFTKMKIGLLDWVESNQVDLQKDPEFQEEVRKVLDDQRRSIESRSDYSWTEKDLALRQMGLDQEQILENPKAFKAALKDYKKILNAEQYYQNLNRSCRNVF
jgi:hypothetical protein